MRSYITVIALFILGGFAAHAQNREVLFTYGADTVYKDEFIRVFLKNNPKEEQTDSSIKAYLDLYINFKLKVKAAKALHLDTLPSFRNELKGYRDQLAKSYMTDTSMTSKLIDEAYERMKYEVNVSHILILCPVNALPKDTLIAYKKILDLRKKALSGVPFDTIAFQSSEDISARSNMGNLGYFSSFDMIYPFETQAYETPKGNISQVFRTEFGYHILKVIDKREYRGEVKVAHLMVRVDGTSGGKEQYDIKRKVDSIYSRLQAGSDWNTMVNTYSDDASTKANGGELNWVSSMARGVPVAFREQAFAMNTPGEISKPVLTEFGWHIIKFIDKKGLASKESMMDKLRMQVNREPERVKMNKQALVTKLKKENGFTLNQKGYDLLMNNLDSSMIKGTFSASKVKNPQTELFTVGTRKIKVADFAAYLESHQTAQGGALKPVIAGMFTEFEAEQVLQYEEDNLETKYPAFRYLMEEYHDGILLFNLTEKTVWNKAIEDTTGLKGYYEGIKTKYTWPDRVNASIYECSSKDAYKLTKKMLKEGKSDTEILTAVNEKNPLSLVIKKSKFEKGDNTYIDGVNWTEGVYYPKDKTGKFIIVKVNEVLPAGPKKLNEVKGVVTGEYQTYLEQQWLAGLRADYPVVVNQKAVDSLLK